MIYLVTMEDTHTDPEYVAFRDLKAALNYAADELVKSMKHYKHGEQEVDITNCNGREGWWLSASSDCGSYHISVRSIEVRW